MGNLALPGRHTTVGPTGCSPSSVTVAAWRSQYACASRMSGAFIDGSTGQVVNFVTCDGELGELFNLTIPVGPQSVFLVLTETGLL